MDGADDALAGFDEAQYATELGDAFDNELADSLEDDTADFDDSLDDAEDCGDDFDDSGDSFDFEADLEEGV